MTQVQENQTFLFDNMRKLINLIDELKDVGVQQYIQLPKIVVFGGQSSGKSSLLEAIVGLDFLPRGQGVVTRCPLELRLVHTRPHNNEELKPYAVFPTEGEQRYYDFNRVREKIIELTDKVAGNNKGIKDEALTMTVYSPNCPDLTLVDLPGITRIPLPGSDQPDNIYEITTGMCRRYMKDPRTIILCVIPANQDMTTLDALKMALEEDKDKSRTIGVVTKIDIMGPGSNARGMLLGKDVPLNLGFVGVKGRSQHDININMGVKEALKIEKEYFASEQSYASLPPGYVGTEALTQKLTKVFYGHIKRTLPMISQEINAKMGECERRIRELGEPMPVSVNEKRQLLWNLITKFTEGFKNNIRGKYDPNRRFTREAREVSGGARIKLMYADLYSEWNGKRATEHLKDSDIHRAIMLYQGDSIPGFPSVDSFLYLISPILEKLRTPALELVNNVYSYLEELSMEMIDQGFERFPGLVEDINEIVVKAMQEEKERTRELIENVIEAERSYLFTNNIEYLNQRTSFIPKAENQQMNVDPDQMFVNEMRMRIDAYFSIVLGNIRDTIPKIVGHFMVRSIQEKLHFSLVNEMNKKDEVMETMGEPKHIIIERETMNKVLGVLKKAKLVLTKDEDIALSFQESKALSAQVIKEQKSQQKPSEIPREISDQKRSVQASEITSKDLAPRTISNNPQRIPPPNITFVPHNRGNTNSNQSYPGGSSDSSLFGPSSQSSVPKQVSTTQNNATTQANSLYGTSFQPSTSNQNLNNPFNQGNRNNSLFQRQPQDPSGQKKS